MRPTRTAYLYAPPAVLIRIGILAAGIFAFMPIIRGHFWAPNFRIALFILFAVVALVYGPLLAYARIRVFSSKKCAQRDRDLFASQLLGHLTEAPGERVPFTYYIRPFFADDQIRLNFRSEGSATAWRYGKTFDLEQVLTDAVDRSMTAVTLGGPQGYGPGRVVVADAHWQDAFLLLATGADFILALPFAQSATEWEILTLRDKNYLHKTIFVVPPHRKLRKANFVLDRAARQTADIFKLSKERFSNAGLAFPEFTRRGGLFVLNDDGSLHTWAPLEFPADFSPDDLRTYLNAVLKRMTGGHVLAER